MSLMVKQRYIALKDSRLGPISGSISLGCDVELVTIRDDEVKSAIEHWKPHIGRFRAEDVERFSVFVTVPPEKLDAPNFSKTCGYIFGHLRLLSPHRSSADNYIDVERNEKLEITGIGLSHLGIGLEDCEWSLMEGFTDETLKKIRSWMPWILKLQRDWKEYRPLYLSMFFHEKAYLEQDLLVRCLFRVMAIEALFGSEEEFGKKALVRRVEKFLGWRVDLMSRYQASWKTTPPQLVTDKLLTELYQLRNKIAHADSIPKEYWREERQGMNYPLTRIHTLIEAALEITRLTWVRIMEENLQDVFSNKDKLRHYFEN